jgi:peptidoglycan/LPS O-acetylase OafA/YrhL
MISGVHSSGAKIDAINGLRGLAAILVIYFHSLFPVILQQTGFDWIIRHGWMGVNLFFMLSGFVLYRPYFTKQRAFNSRQDIWVFYKHRFFRLYPLFTFNLLVCLLLMGPVTAERLQAFFIALVGLSGFSLQHLLPPLNPVLWSLAVEIWFSVLFPFVVIAVGKYGFKKIFFLILTLALVTRIAGMFFANPNVNISILRDSLLGRLDDFLVGMLIVRLYYQHTYFTKLSALQVWGITLLSVGFLLTAFIGWDFTIRGNYTWYSLPLLNNCIQIGFAGILVLSLKEHSLLNRLFRTWALQVTGLMCYSLYIWHYLFTASFQLPVPFVANYLLYLLAVASLAAFTYRYLEFGHIKDTRTLFLLRHKAS